MAGSHPATDNAKLPTQLVGFARWNLRAVGGVESASDRRLCAAMCYETYERLLRARAFRRAADQSMSPDREEPTQDTSKRPVQPVTLDEVRTREEEPA